MAKPQYGRAHRKARDKALDMMPNGAPCPRCNRPMYRWQRLHLGHVVSVAVGGSNGPTRIEHGTCNESAGARLGNRLRRNRRRSSKGMPSLGERVSDMDGMPSDMGSDIGGMPSVYRDSKAVSNRSKDGKPRLGDRDSGIKSNRTSANTRLPKW